MSVHGLGRRTIGALLPRSFLDVVAVLGFNFDPTKDPVSFSFHRQRRAGTWGWATFLHVGALAVCAPWIDGLPFPRRRADAERWVREFCARVDIVPMLNVGHCGNPERAPGARAEAEARRRRAAFHVVATPIPVDGGGKVGR